MAISTELKRRAIKVLRASHTTTMYTDDQQVLLEVAREFELELAEEQPEAVAVATAEPTKKKRARSRA